MCRLLINNMSIQSLFQLIYKTGMLYSTIWWKLITWWEKKEFHFQTHNGTFNNPFFHLPFTLIDCEDFIFQIDVVSRLKYIRKNSFWPAEKLM